MSSIRLIQEKGPIDISLDCVFRPISGADDTVALARAVMVAINSDRLALADDVLPNSKDDNRRGWWGDLDAETIWNGWPIGSRIWLLTRDKITDSSARGGATIAKATRYINECLQPFVDAAIFSRFTVALAQIGIDQISGTITIYRGPKSTISLQYQSLWTEYGG